MRPAGTRWSWTTVEVQNGRLMEMEPGGLIGPPERMLLGDIHRCHYAAFRERDVIATYATLAQMAEDWPRARHMAHRLADATWRYYPAPIFGLRFAIEQIGGQILVLVSEDEHTAEFVKSRPVWFGVLAEELTRRIQKLPADRVFLLLNHVVQKVRDFWGDYHGDSWPEVSCRLGASIIPAPRFGP